jgi:hypothetical protein
VLLTHGEECHMCHLLDGVIHVTSNDCSGPRCCGVDGYLHPDLTTSQAVGLEWPAVLDRDRPVVAESHERAQQHPREARAVLAHSQQPTALAKGAMGVVVHVQLRKQIKKVSLSHCKQLGKKNGKIGPKANSSNIK